MCQSWREVLAVVVCDSAARKTITAVAAMVEERSFPVPLKRAIEFPAWV